MSQYTGNPAGRDFGILLVDPGIQLKTTTNAKYVNRGLLSIYTFLKSQGFEVSYFPFDQYGNEGRVYDELENIIKEKDIKLSAISNLFTAETANVLKIAQFIKGGFPDNITVIGGYNPTLMNQDLIKRPEIDFIINGEGEWALRDLASAMSAGRPVNGIAGLVSKEFVGPKRRHGNLEELPAIDYSGLPREYLIGPNPPRVNFEINRGCHNNCTFCSVSQFWQRKIRSHNPDKLIDELEGLKKIGYRGTFSLEESMVDFKSPKIKRFLGQVSYFRDNFEFDFITSRYDSVDNKSISLLDEIGFQNLMLGLESGSPKVLATLNKNIDLDRFVETCKIVRPHEIRLNVYMIVGLPGETKETYQETYDFLTRMMDEKLIDTVFPCYFQPYRGTKAREDIKKHGGRILADEKDYFRWLMRDEPLVEYEGLKREELKEMMEKMLYLNREVKNPVIEKLR
ncbi:MAG: radical SAM protein [Candidatus Woesearchaeota archaeon]